MNDDSNILENLFCFGIIFSVYSSIMQECLEKDYRGSYSTNLEDEAAVKYKKIYMFPFTDIMQGGVGYVNLLSKVEHHKRKCSLLTICCKDVEKTATQAHINPLAFTFTSVTVQTPTPITTTTTAILTSFVYFLL